MVKKITLIIAMLATFVAQPVLACDGYYMALRAGVINHNVGETGATNSNRFEVGNNDMMVAGALGYRYGHWRGELEYIWREEAQQSAGVSTTAFQTETFMLNGYYDLTPYSRYTPFISAGLGVTNINLDLDFGPSSSAFSFEETNFTWSVGGGISAKLTNRWNLDAGYRFYNMGSIEDASIRSHEVYGGARYIF